MIARRRAGALGFCGGGPTPRDHLPIDRAGLAQHTVAMEKQDEKAQLGQLRIDRQAWGAGSTPRRRR